MKILKQFCHPNAEIVGRRFLVRQTQCGDFLIHEYHTERPPAGRCQTMDLALALVRDLRLKNISTRPERQAQRKLWRLQDNFVHSLPTLFDRQINYQKRMHSVYSDIQGASRRASSADRHLGRLSENFSPERLESRNAHQTERWVEIREADKIYNELSRQHNESAIARENLSASDWERQIIVCEKLLDKIEEIHVL